MAEIRTESALELATRLGDALLKCDTQIELGLIASEIKANSRVLIEFLPWLRDIYESKLNYDLNTPKYRPKDVLNKNGLKALARGEITLWY